MRNFTTGATRDTDTGKYDYEGFISPVVMEAFAAYMHFNRLQADGNLRGSDNWQNGIPLDVYMKSGWRHFFDWWREHREIETKEGVVFALCGLMFNLQGYLHELLKADETMLDYEIARAEVARKQRWAEASEQR